MRNLWGHNWRLYGEVKGYMFDNGGCMPYNVWYKGRYRAALAVEKLFSCCDQNLKIWSCSWPLSFFCSSSSSSSYSLSCLSSSTKTSSPNHHYHSHVHMFTIWRQKLFCCFFPSPHPVTWLFFFFSWHFCQTHRVRPSHPLLSGSVYGSNMQSALGLVITPPPPHPRYHVYHDQQQHHLYQIIITIVIFTCSQFLLLLQSKSKDLELHLTPVYYYSSTSSSLSS